MYLFMYVCLHICLCMYAYIFVYVCMPTYLCMSVHACCMLVDLCIYVGRIRSLSGGSWIPTSYSGRVIFGTFLITSVCIVATYTSNLVAFFTVTTFHLPFNTLDEMIKQSAVSWATVEGISLYFFLKVRRQFFPDLVSMFEGLLSLNLNSLLVDTRTNRHCLHINITHIHPSIWYLQSST